MNQTQAFISGAGNDWFERNHRRLGERDPVGEMIMKLGLAPKRVLEVGCANGWRLKRLRATHGCAVAGIDPSRNAIFAAQAGLDAGEFKQGWADRLEFLDDAFDLVIYGFCLYVTDPEDWFTIVSEGDRVVAAGGHIVVHDFSDFAPPYARKYAHAEDVLAYHVDFTAFWLANPTYRLVEQTFSDRRDETVSVIAKAGRPLPVLP